MRRADASMYEGKRFGKDTAVVYQPMWGFAADFPTALRQAEGGIPAGFSLLYQPIVRLSDGKPRAVEALARSTAPNGTQLPPETFVAAAEAAGLGAALDAMGSGSRMQRGQERRLGHRAAREHRSGAAGQRRVRGRGAPDPDAPWMAPEQLVVEITETVPVVISPTQRRRSHG